MNRLSTVRGATAVLMLVAVMAACKKKEAATPPDTMGMAMAPAAKPEVSGIDLGKSITTDNHIASPTTSFRARDTIYASVTTQNAAAGSALVAKWTYQDGQVVDSTSQAVAPAGAGGATSVTEFHISKKSAWPVGKYKVELFLDGASVGSKDFQIGK